MRTVIRFAFALTFTCAVALAGELGFARTAQATEYQFSWAHPRPQGNSLGGADFEDSAIGYAVGDRGSVVKSTDGGLSWSLVTPVVPSPFDLKDVLVLGPGQLLAVGTSPGIFLSVDGGISWSPVANPSSATLNDLERVAGPNLAAIGDAGQVLTSSDDGATWTLRGSFGSDAFGQYWSSPLDGYVAGQSRVRRTTDGGMTWSPLNGIPDQAGFFAFGDVLFPDAAHGYIASDFSLWKTTNGGATWSSLPFPGALAYLGTTVALSTQHLIGSTNLEGAQIFETTDGGATWEVLLYSGAGAFLDFDRLGDGTLLAYTSEGDIFRSSDAGATWTNRIDAAAPERQTLGGICAWPGGRGAAGTSGTPGTRWYESTDGGATFHHDPSGPAIAFTSEIDYWDADHAIAAGDFLKMWYTSNGGADWTSVNLPSPPSNGAAWSISLPAPGIAFAAVTGQSQCQCYRTTDYGVTWQPRNTGLPATGGWAGISFVDADHGFIAGYSGSANRLYRTTNGGGQWTAVPMSGLGATYIRDIHFHDLSTGLAAFSNSPGGIYRTTDGGSTWASVWPNNTFEFAFSDALHGAAAPEPYGAGGQIFVTEDGGATWQALTLPATAAGTCVAALPDGFLVGGDDGVVMKVTRLDPAAVEPGGGEFAAAPLRLQAPLSVGPRLRVAFELPRAGFADLSILDVQGRRVASLLRGSYEAGRPITAEWDGSRDDGSARRGGIYFARLSSGGRATAVKLVFVE